MRMGRPLSWIHVTGRLSVNGRFWPTEAARNRCPHKPPVLAMANDEYEFAGRGALKLKGSKVKKNKKKQKEKSSLETALVTRDSLPSKGRRSTSPRENPKTTVSGGAEGLEALEPKKHGDGATEEDEDDVPVVKTAAEKRFDEARRKKV
jgi:hypothetical protein